MHACEWEMLPQGGRKEGVEEAVYMSCKALASRVQHTAYTR